MFDQNQPEQLRRRYNKKTRTDKKKKINMKKRTQKSWETESEFDYTYIV